LIEFSKVQAHDYRISKLLTYQFWDTLLCMENLC